MLSNTLNTNEVKDSAGAEVEFSRISIGDRSTEFAKVGESPALPHRLKIDHQEIGVGFNKRRRSRVRIDRTKVSDVDLVTPVVTSFYVVLDSPIGALLTGAEAAHVIAEVTSFLATLGTNTLLYDGTGTGSAAVLSGGL